MQSLLWSKWSAKAKQRASVLVADLRLLIRRERQTAERSDVLLERELRIVRAEQHVVDADVADRPDELGFDRRVRDHSHGRRDVEVDVVAEQTLGGARRLQDVPEAEVHRAHVREDELR